MGIKPDNMCVTPIGSQIQAQSNRVIIASCVRRISTLLVWTSEHLHNQDTEYQFQDFIAQQD